MTGLFAASAGGADGSADEDGEEAAVVGVGDRMVVYADGAVAPILRAVPPIDRAATRALVAWLYPEHEVVPLADGNLRDDIGPSGEDIYAACYPGLTIVCARDLGLTRPSRLDTRFVEAAGGWTVYLHTMNTKDGRLGFGLWEDGTLRRALSLSPTTGVVENVGEPLEFEAPYWAGERPAGADPDEPYPLPFDPTELGEDALRTLFGFNLSQEYTDDPVRLDDVVLAGYALRQRRPRFIDRVLPARRRTH